MEDGLYELVRTMAMGDPVALVDPGITIPFSGPHLDNAGDRPVMAAEYWRDGPENDPSTVVINNRSTTAINFYYLPAKITKISVYMKFRSRDGYLYTNYGSYYAWAGSPSYAGCPLKLFININGTYYYSNSYTLNTNWNVENEITFEWAVNPATGQPWAEGDLTVENAFYGAILTAPYVQARYAQLEILRMFATIYHDDGAGNETVSYKKVNCDNIILTQYSQSPIKPDVLTFTLDAPMPERTELALVKDGVMVWRGLAWTFEETVTNRFDVVAKSQQVLLDYRLIGVEYVEKNGADISDIFSDGIPGTILDYAYKRELIGGQTNNAIYKRFFGNVASYHGLFYFLNSWRGQMATQMASSLDNPAVTTLALASGNFVSGPSAGILSVLSDHAAKTHILPGSNDMGNMILSNEFNFHGVASSRFSEFFSKMGQEVRYRYGWDGNVHQDVAVEIANGSASNPLIKFIDGINCIITKQIPIDFKSSAAIGLGNNPKVASFWKKTNTWISKIFNTSEYAEDLNEYLESKLCSDETVYQISAQEEIWHVRPGDYIAVQCRDEAAISVRVRQITTGQMSTRITAGKRLTDLNDQFGTLRNAGATHDTTSIKTTDMGSSNECALSKSITITAANLALGGWQCLASISWGFTNNAIYYPNADPNSPGWAVLSRTIAHDYGNVTSKMYLYIYGDYFSDYGAHLYEFQGVGEMTATGVEPYGTNDVTINQRGTFRWRKDGGAWHGPYPAADYWHLFPPDAYDQYLGDGIYARVIFYVSPSGSPWLYSRATELNGQSLTAQVCSTIDINNPKFLMLTVGGKVIPPGRWLAVGDSGSLSVDITEFLNVAGTYTVAATLVGGLKKSTNPLYYNTLSGSIEEKKHTVALEE